MIECKIPGCDFVSENSIVAHIRLCHKMTASIYRKLYNAQVYSPNFRKTIRENVSNQMKKRWTEDKEYREKHLKKLHASGDNISKTLKRKYENGEMKTWNKGLTKKDDDRLKHIGEANRKHLTGKKNPQKSEWAKIHSIFVTHNPSKFKTDIEKKLWREKISKTLCERIANGEIEYSTHRYKNGHYIGKYNIEFYQSSLELAVMEFLDSCKYVLYWTKKHKKRVQYLFDGINKFYYPDFLIKLSTGKIIIVESKGWLTEDAKIKHEFATDFFSSFFVIFSVEQLQTIINANCDINFLSNLIGAADHGYKIDKFPNNEDRPNQIHAEVVLMPVENLSETERGAGGFGSTGV